MWMTSSGGQPFFYWLDVGDGKTVNHPECSREKLRQERNTYLELHVAFLYVCMKRAFWDEMDKGTND
ncbi:hypothetical protein NC653_035374 [Populus alba x Populus x berolinensis]|uniref:Uncharacterized protein n=1 Tax=Populus alba x Populus x berolinensis TaxID=444605 RepID=A0AAD6LPR1_9ROSI|nr:hypothetical protein NC653_035366 [Populus alba x Populus x berolinensis]KAJ6971076.1 hypothetical protein NC653_035374 [Populus alba x Populus x berolinensis]